MVWYGMMTRSSGLAQSLMEEKPSSLHAQMQKTHCPISRTDDNWTSFNVNNEPAIADWLGGKCWAWQWVLWLYDVGAFRRTARPLLRAPFLRPSARVLSCLVLTLVLSTSRTTTISSSIFLLSLRDKLPERIAHHQFFPCWT